MQRSIKRRAGAGFVLLATLVLSACSAGGQPAEFDETFTADRLLIRDFIGTLTIETVEAGGEIALHVDATRAQLDLLPIDVVGETLVIEWDGEPDRLRRWYEFWRGRWMVDLNQLDRYPTVVLSVPADVAIEVTNIIGRWTVGDREGHIAFGAERGGGTIGATETADMSVSGDANLTIGPVAGRLSAAIAGSGSLFVESAVTADVSIAGSGDMTIGNLAGELTMSVAGSGGIVAGDAAEATAVVSGSGSVRLGAVAAGLNATVQGSGSVAADSVDGRFNASVSGSGSIDVDAGYASAFEVTIAGSGNVAFRGTAVNPVARISGSGGLILGAVEGTLNAATAGTGQVQVLR